MPLAEFVRISPRRCVHRPEAYRFNLAAHPSFEIESQGAMSGFAEGYQRAVPQGMDVVEEDDDDEDNGVVILDSWTANSVVRGWQ